MGTACHLGGRNIKRRNVGGLASLDDHTSTPRTLDSEAATSEEANTQRPSETNAEPEEASASSRLKRDQQRFERELFGQTGVAQLEQYELTEGAKPGKNELSEVVHKYVGTITEKTLTGARCLCPDARFFSDIY